ncbi:MAG: SemiSWEET transporter [Methylotenera sp.]|nr:SemiSWEET transporter [Methylotenera sp.]PPD18585.1 MAG: hypothetical protein CTY27_01315 [Methylotenera sp.]
MIFSHYASWIGGSAALLTTIAFLPQAYKSYKTRDLSGISLPMYSILTLGVALWMIYGVLIGDWPLIVSNSITLCSSIVILSLKILQVKNGAPQNT